MKKQSDPSFTLVQTILTTSFLNKVNVYGGRFMPYQNFVVNKNSHEFFFFKKKSEGFIHFWRTPLKNRPNKGVLTLVLNSHSIPA